MSKVALLDEENLFELETAEEEEQLTIELFQEIEAEVCDHALHTPLREMKLMVQLSLLEKL